MADSVMDFSALDASAVSSAAESTEQVETTEVSTEQGAEHETTEQADKPSELQTPEEKAEAEKAAKEGKITPTKAREALKAWKAANPENKAMANHLNNEIGRAEAFTRVFPGGVKEAQEFKQLVDNYGGVEGLSGLSEQMESVKQADQLLYDGNGEELIKNIVEDLKSENKIESLGKIAPAFLQALFENDRQGYNRVFVPHFIDGLHASGIPEQLQEVVTAFDAKDPEKLKQGLSKIVQWYNSILKTAGDLSKAPKVNPEVEALKNKLSEKEQAEETSFKKETNAEATRNDQKLIVAAMIPMLKMPFFKDFPKETKQELGRDIQHSIYRQLNSDKTVSAQVNKLLKSRDKAKAVSYWNSQVEKVAPEVAKKVIKSRYPGYDRTPAKRATTTTTQTPQKKFGETVTYVAQKPAYESIDFSDRNAHAAYIAGTAKLKTGQYVTWKRKA